MTASPRNSAAVLGCGESEIGQVPGMTGLGLYAQAARRAIENAGLRPGDIGGPPTAYSFAEPYFMLGSVLAEYLGPCPAVRAAMIAGGAYPDAGLALVHDEGGILSSLPAP